MPWDKFSHSASGRLEYWPMAGIAAGVAGEADVNGLPGPPTGTQLALSSPATWTYIWVGLSAAYLIAVYVGMIRITRR